jgi:hypothetical protein
MGIPINPSGNLTATHGNAIKNVGHAHNTPLEFTEGPSQSRPIQREFYDITLLAGVRVSL